MSLIWEPNHPVPTPEIDFDAPAPTSRTVGNVTYHNVDQCTDEWFALRCGILTASTVKHILTPAQLKKANNEKSRAHLYELVAQRIAGYVEVLDFTSDDMERGNFDEIEAVALYSEHYAPVTPCGFITNSKWGFTLGYSPDGLVGDDGLIECKSRRHKFQVQTILEGAVPVEYMMQVQTGLLVSERNWIDFVSRSAGLHQLAYRVHPDNVVQNAIVEAAGDMEAAIADALERYADRLSEDGGRYVATERREEVEDAEIAE